MIKDSLHRLLTDLCTPEVVDQAEQGNWPETLWQALTETGLTLAGISETAGGSGGEVTDSVLVIQEAAGFCAPLPLAEHFIAAMLLERVGNNASTSPMTVAEGDFKIADGLLVGSAEDVAFARWASSIVLVAKNGGESFVCKVPAGSVTISEGSNMAGEPRDMVDVNMDVAGIEVCEASPDAENALHVMGAALRGAQMAGALNSVLAMSVQYSLERQQFGRPISKFQAIQQQLAILAGEVAASTRAAHAISAAFESLNEMDIAIGKARIGESVSVCADIAHQVHGAMGYTMEHSLNHRTRRLWSWRNDFGSERTWQILVGKAFLANGADAIWDGITSRG